MRRLEVRDHWNDETEATPQVPSRITAIPTPKATSSPQITVGGVIGQDLWEDDEEIIVEPSGLEVINEEPANDEPQPQPEPSTTHDSEPVQVVPVPAEQVEQDTNQVQVVPEQVVPVQPTAPSQSAASDRYGPQWADDLLEDMAKNAEANKQRKRELAEYRAKLAAETSSSAPAIQPQSMYSPLRADSESMLQDHLRLPIYLEYA